MFDAIQRELTKQSKRMTKLRYQRYLVAVHVFSKKKVDGQASERKRATSALSQAEAEKTKLVSQRAEMISQGLFDDHSRDQFDARIQELADTIDDLKYRRGKAT